MLTTIGATAGVRLSTLNLNSRHSSVTYTEGQIAMRTIRAIVRGRNLQPIDPINFPENTQLTVALLDADDLPADAIALRANDGGAFDFLSDPREGIYSDFDGEAV